VSQRNCAGRRGSLRTREALLAGLALAALAGVRPAPAADARTLDVVSARRSDRGLVFALRLPEGLPPDREAALDQGEPVTVTYEVEIVRDRRLWFNTTVTRGRVEVAAVFDPLTQRYSLERRPGDGAEATTGEAGSRDEALRWLVELRGFEVPVEPGPLERPRLRWRARAIFARKLVMLFVPTTVKTRWSRGPVSGEEGLP
jgi:hypothetical protein